MVFALDVYKNAWETLLNKSFPPNVNEGIIMILFDLYNGR